MPAKRAGCGAIGTGRQIEGDVEASVARIVGEAAHVQIAGRARLDLEAVHGAIEADGNILCGAEPE